MQIDLTIRSGPGSGLNFGFIPSQHAVEGRSGYDRNERDAFHVTEMAFWFLLTAIAERVPRWKEDYHYYGVSSLSAQTWYAILPALDRLRFDLRSGVHPKVVLARHRAYLGRNIRLNRRATLNFLDRFESRVRTVLAQSPYLLIEGI